MLREGVGQGYVELPAEAIQDVELKLGEPLLGNLPAVHLAELRQRRQLAVKEFGGDEETRGCNCLDERVLVVYGCGGRELRKTERGGESGRVRLGHGGVCV
jgi:hypothetical protein